MKILKRITLILILSALSWTVIEFYKLFNSEINFFELKQVPISLAFFISTLLFGLSTREKFNVISFVLFLSSTAILSIALFSEISYITFFKIESLILLIFGAYTFRMLSKRKPFIFSMIYFGTIALFSFTILSGISNHTIEILQGLLAIMTTICVLLTLFVKKFN